MRDNSTIPNKYYINSSIAVLNLIGIVYIFYICPTYNLVCHLTLWGYYLNCAYLTLNLITDTNFYVLKKTNLEKLNDVVRSTYGAIANTFTYLVFLLFWFILFLGLAIGIDTLGPTQNPSAEFIFRNFYLHLFITVFVVVDIALEEHKEIKYDKQTLIWICEIFGAYCIVSLISIYGFDTPPYPFLGMGGFPMLAFTLSSVYVVTIGCYFFHIFLVGYFNQKRKNEEGKKTEKNGFKKVATELH